MKNIFCLFVFTAVTFNVTVAQTLIEKMQKEKVSITGSVDKVLAEKSPNARQDLTGISNNIEELFDSLSSYYDVESKKSTKNSSSEKLLLIVQSKNQLQLLNVGVLQLQATLMLEMLEGGHHKEIDDLYKRIDNNNQTLNKTWNELFK
jgi:hypothetical protein